ncbi:MAG: DUF2788 domain-containing protein [Burkholderiaceae bacterium]|jgi:hypothetical protein|nr:DUF2788 domain-containing protein [Burkholderiaceae bacterium]
MNTVFGFTEAQISWFGVTFGLGALMLYMLFIIGNLAWRSKAGKFGTFVLFLVLALCIAGFLAKLIIEVVIEHQIRAGGGSG